MSMKWKNWGCDAPEGVWITADGREIPIKEMSPEHIRNCLDYITTFGGVLTSKEKEKFNELDRELLER